MRAMTLLDTGSTAAFASGIYAVEIVREAIGRQPVLTLSGWTFRRRHIADVLAVAERRGVKVFIVSEQEVGADV